MFQTILAGATVGTGIISFMEAKNSASSIKRQAEYAARQNEFNSALIDFQIKDVKKIALDDVFQRETLAKKMVGSQKVSLAGQGVQIEGELGQAFEEEERTVANLDVATIKNNAWREVLGLEVKKMDLMSQAANVRLEGKEKARSTLVTGGLALAGSGIDAGSRMSRK